MLSPKVLSNAKRYTKEGIETNIELSDDETSLAKVKNFLSNNNITFQEEE